LPVLFLGFWLILNERVTPEVVVSGILVSALASLINYRFVGVSFATERKIWGKIFSLIWYLILLVGEVFRASFAMIELILSPKVDNHIKPQIVYFGSPLRSEFAKVVLANSITLTPGTLTVKMEEGKYGVYAIDPPFGEGVEKSKFVSILKKMEGGQGRV